MFDANFPMYYIGVRDGKKEKWKKKAKIILSILIFFPTILLATLNKYTKFGDFGSYRSRKICDGNFCWRERKMDNKGNDTQEEAGSLTQYNKLYPTFVPDFKILGSVVPEKSLTKKKFTHKPTHKHCY